MKLLLSLLLMGFPVPAQTVQEQLNIVADSSRSAEQRRAAIESIAAAAEVDVRALIPVYRAILEDPNADTTLRVAAVSGLLVPVFREPSKEGLLRELIPSFLECLKSDQVRLRENCAMGLAGFVAAPLPASSFPELLAASEDPSWQVRRYAIATLQRADVPVQQSLDALLDRLAAEEHANVIQAGLASAGRHGVASSRLLAFVISKLEDRQSPNRPDAIQLLKDLGPKAREALPTLRRISADPTEAGPLRQAAERAIRSITTP